MPIAAHSPWVAFSGAVQRAGFSFVRALGPVCRRLARSRSAPVDGRLLDPELAVVLALDDLTGHSDLRRLSPAAARTRVATDILIVGARPRPSVVHADLEIPGPAGAIPARVYRPRTLPPGPSPAIVYFHGGGWVTGSVATHEPLCQLLAEEAGCCVVSVDYRLAPEHRFPAAVDDAVAAFRWVVARAGDLEVEATRVAVAGDSAGGNLAAVVARRTADDPLRPKLAALLYPALDATCALPSHQDLGERYFLTTPMIAWYYGHYLGDQDPRHPDVSPLHATPRPEVALRIYASGFDPLRDEAEAYAKRLRDAGGDVTYRELTDMPHGFCLMMSASDRAHAATVAIARELGAALSA